MQNKMLSKSTSEGRRQHKTAQDQLENMGDTDIPQMPSFTLDEMM